MLFSHTYKHEEQCLSSVSKYVCTFDQWSVLLTNARRHNNSVQVHHCPFASPFIPSRAFY